EPERQLLRRLSVFAGGFSLEAAEAICSGDGIEAGDVLALVSELVERSLVMADIHGPSARYRLLETVRQYASEKLIGTRGGETVRARHLDWFLSLALHAEPMLTVSDERSFDRLEAEHDNIRAALDTSLLAGTPEKGLRLAAALRRFWQVRGYWTEGRQRLEMLLRAGAGVHDAVRAKAMNAAAQLAQHQGDYGRARALAEESLALFRALRDPSGVASALNVLGNVRYEQGDYQVARRLHDESLASAREAGDTPMAAASLLNLGVIADHEGEYARAEAVCQESLGLFRQVDDRRGIAAALNALGVVAADQGDYTTARIRHEESLAIRRGLGDRRGIAGSLSSLGMVAVPQGDFASARRYFEENLAIRRELGDRHGIGTALRSLGLLAWREGDSAQATALLEESLTLRKAQGSRLGVAECLEALAQIAVAADPTKAGRLLAAASTLRHAIGAPLPSSDLASYERTVAAARLSLGTSVFQATWEEGRTMTLDQAVQHALAVRTG
ncbi:MAG: ATP-binding protein, partial [Burkholderiales bacterium]